MNSKDDKYYKSEQDELDKIHEKDIKNQAIIEYVEGIIASKI